NGAGELGMRRDGLGRDGDVGAVARGPQGDRQADAATASGHEESLAAEVAHADSLNGSARLRALPHLPEPVPVGREGGEASVMNGVPDAKLAAGRLDDGRELGIVDVTHLWKQVVLDLVVEPAEVPGEEAAPTREIGGRFHLVYGPRRRDVALLGERREGRVGAAVSQLKHDAENDRDQE